MQRHSTVYTSSHYYWKPSQIKCSALRAHTGRQALFNKRVCLKINKLISSDPLSHIQFNYVNVLKHTAVTAVGCHSIPTHDTPKAYNGHQKLV
jgi:hypothetical protein